MDDIIIKSAREIALEKVGKLEKATSEELLKWQYFPEGEKLATRYLKQECNLVAELGKYDEGAKKYVIEGASDVLVRNINLPRDNIAKKTNTKVMDGLKTLKNDKVAVENVFSKMRHVFNHYVTQGNQQRKQAYEALKADFEAKFRQAVQQQYGTAMGFRIDVERQPQFQEEWRKLQMQSDAQYIKLLDEFKQELLSIP